ncbi:MAG: hypothetical protein LAP38_16415 [Acidobacteriia bacterium]|nr:hypothetical protein [Terriglobia bacterium]
MPVEQFSSNGELCLNYLSQLRGPPQIMYQVFASARITSTAAPTAGVTAQVRPEAKGRFRVAGNQESDGSHVTPSGRQMRNRETKPTLASVGFGFAEAPFQLTSVFTQGGLRTIHDALSELEKPVIADTSI